MRLSEGDFLKLSTLDSGRYFLFTGGEEGGANRGRLATREGREGGEVGNQTITILYLKNYQNNQKYQSEGPGPGQKRRNVETLGQSGASCESNY